MKPTTPISEAEAPSALERENIRLDADREELIEMMTLQAHQARVTLGMLELALSRFGVGIVGGQREL